MRSPFPGMDPYIETCHLWDDFHHNFISGLQAAIAVQLPKRYVVRAGERTYMTLTTRNGAEKYRMQADVSVATKPSDVPAKGQEASAAVGGAAAEAAPVTM